MVTVHWQGCIYILQFLFIADLEVHPPMSSYFYSENSTGITIYEKINNPVTN